MNNAKIFLFGLLLLTGVAHACLVLNFYGYFNVDFQQHIIEQKKVQECSDLSILKAMATTELAKTFGTERAASDFWVWSIIVSISNVTVLGLLVAVIIRCKSQSKKGQSELDTPTNSTRGANEISV